MSKNLLKQPSQLLQIRSFLDSEMMEKREQSRVITVDNEYTLKNYF